MIIPLVQIDAFAESLFEGNPAAVMPLERWLPDELLQRLALENNLSETAFLVDRDPEDAPDPSVPAYDLRWFTPATEVDLCGHATLAASSYLFEDVHPGAGLLQFSSRSGWLAVSRSAEGLLTMDFPAETPEPVEVDPAIARALGVEVVDAHRATDLICTVADARTVRDLAPDLTFLASLPVRGIAVTAPGEGTGFDFVSRWFGARAGVPEDPVTGSAHCQLAPLWAERLGMREMTARQMSPRGGTVAIRLQDDRVHLSGRCVRYLEGSVTLPR
ncbi:PhzF family phenazine biosynthesis protein [Brachybacterium phenoliresistens]|uniref:Isomerase n=1 Tax=Brachybacterium phenoliresistens TaxID=396014 RepID=Z9JPM0_9MICO|nr:PhzF family phenazine biosynthesis protein [Brachybacterium phenoliresistens]EWS79746.1 isomerase [Brachybacterium phenoliresistens]